VSPATTVSIPVIIFLGPSFTDSTSFFPDMDEQPDESNKRIDKNNPQIDRPNFFPNIM
jgi:hypothetical protein